MNYIISESQLDKIIFRYLDNRNFIVVETQNKIFFTYSKDDEQAQIRYDKNFDRCFVYFEIINKISDFLPVSSVEVRECISRWVAHTLNVKVLESYYVGYTTYYLVKMSD
jgi:hypothetical protein